METAASGNHRKVAKVGKKERRRATERERERERESGRQAKLMLTGGYVVLMV